MYKIFIPPLLGHSFTFPCSVWHICVQTVNIWTEIRRVTPRVRMNLAWVRMTYCFKKFKRQSKKKLETGECHPWQGESVTFSHQLQEFVAASPPSCPGHSPRVLTWSLPWTCALCSTAKLWAPWAVPPFLFFLSAGTLHAFFPHTPLPLALLACILCPGGSTQGQCSLEGKEEAWCIHLFSRQKKQQGTEDNKILAWRCYFIFCAY